MNETRDFLFELKHLGEGGAIEGVAAGYGNRDLHGDIIASGAFAKSLLDHGRRGTMPAMLLHHDMNRPIGAWHSLTETPGGLLAKGQLTLEATDGREAYALLHTKALTGLSVGFANAKREIRSGSRDIVSGELLEVSLVAVPANPEARVTRVKGAPTTRDIERALADIGLSTRQAKGAATLVDKHISQSNDQHDEAAERLAAIFASARDGLQPFLKRI